MSQTTCEHPPCDCDIGSDGGLVAGDGRRFCSEGCRDGDGCVCPACGCSMDTTDGSGSAVPKL